MVMIKGEDYRPCLESTGIRGGGVCLETGMGGSSNAKEVEYPSEG